MTKLLKQALVFLPFLALIFASFKPAASNADLYVYLRFQQYDSKADTYHLIVSEVINYDDWKNNSIDLRKKFATAAASQVPFEVWQASISAEGVSESVDDTRVKGEAWIKSVKDYYTKSSVKVYRVYVKK